MADVNLCENCRIVLTTKRPWLSEWSQHHTEYDSLIASVASGCVICTWISVQTPPAPVNSHEDQKSFQTYCDFGDLTAERVEFRGKCSWAAPFGIEVRIDRHETGSFSHDVAIDLSGRSYTASSTISELEGTDIGTKQSIGTIKTWLGSCREDHPYCVKSTDKTFFPTRIIDVENVKSGMVVLRYRNDVIKGFPEAKDHAGSQKAFPEYWTLSHRWGDPELIYKLLQENEQDFRQGIAMEKLSSTFRDAVTLVHKLGYRYIWIDSLCIIQDSESNEDWRREAPTMKDIYGNSFCNISAIRSSYDVSFGLFGERYVKPRLFHSFSANVDKKNLTEKWKFSLGSLWVNEINRAPLNSRGWVVQERFLSRRIIHFTRSQIYWECLECCRCEADPVDQFGLLHTNSGSEFGRQIREYKLALRAIIMESIPVEERHNSFYSMSGRWATPRECWRMMVTTYSLCNFTYETDRLIAISGIAKRFEKLYSHDEYFEGIWKEGLHTDLLWESNAFQGGCVIRNKAAASSWSWVSISGGSVTVPAAHQKFAGEPGSCIKFISARIRPEVGSYDSGALPQPSELYIECVLHFFRWDAKSKRIGIYVDEGLSKELYQAGHDKVRLDTKEWVLKFEETVDIMGECIPVQEAYEGYGFRNVRYLLLERVPISELRYKRIGTLSCHGWSLEWDRGKRNHITLI